MVYRIRVLIESLFAGSGRDSSVRYARMNFGGRAWKDTQRKRLRMRAGGLKQSWVLITRAYLQPLSSSTNHDESMLAVDTADASFRDVKCARFEGR